MAELPRLPYVEHLRGHAPEFVELVEAVRARALYTPGALDVKTKLLLAFALDVARGREAGARQLAQRARAAGATDAELVEVLQVLYSVGGMQQLSLGVPALDLPPAGRGSG
jgi:alkylhydroperoxidase/carboxymuconolactone decarboxylase family protein YurZ